MHQSNSQTPKCLFCPWTKPMLHHYARHLNKIILTLCVSGLGKLWGPGPLREGFSLSKRSERSGTRLLQICDWPMNLYHKYWWNLKGCWGHEESGLKYARFFVLNRFEPLDCKSWSSPWLQWVELSKLGGTSRDLDTSRKPYRNVEVKPRSKRAH